MASTAGERFPVSSPVKVLEPKRFADERGWFSETYSERQLLAAGISARFVQDNQSMSRAAGVLRGLHFQTPPHAQAKLVRCVRGRIFDVAVDIRRASPTWGRWVAAELSADNGLQLFVPVGFAHGFLTLEPNTEVFYKVSNFYAPQCDSGIRWDDPTVGVRWPLVEGTAPQLSPKDAALPPLAAFESPFPYDGQPLGPLDPP